MADAEDQHVDDAITRMQALLDELKGAQAKDDEDETPMEDQPKSLAEARIRVKEHFRRRRVSDEA